MTSPSKKPLRPRGKRIEERAAEKRAQRAAARAKSVAQTRANRTSAAQSVFSAAKPEGPLAVWVQIVHSLEQSGFGAAGPEYLRLSQAVRAAHAATQTATRARARRTHEDDAWDAVRTVAQRALELLEPIVAAATLLRELPKPSVSTRSARRSSKASAGPVAEPPPVAAASEPQKALRARARARAKTNPVRQPVAGADSV